MIVCSLEGPHDIPGWGKVLDLRPLENPPPVVPYRLPAWRERVIEVSLLRKPEILAGALGVSVPQRLIALRQVARIDLYLHADRHLHLLEVKRPREISKWQYAVKQIAGHWARSSAWLGEGSDKVSLWALCPAKWSQSRNAPKEPSNWRSVVAQATRTVPTAKANVDLHLLLYCIFRSGGSRYLRLWKAGETSNHEASRGGVAG